MPRLGERLQVLADVAFDVFQPRPRAVEMRVCVCADFVSTRAQFCQRRCVEHLAHHGAALSHEGCAGIEARAPTMLLHEISAVQRRLREVIERERHDGAIRRDEGVVRLAPHCDPALNPGR